MACGVPNTKVITSPIDCKYVQVVDGGAMNEIGDCTVEDCRRQGLTASRIVFWCSFSNDTISLKVIAANKEPMRQGVGIGVEVGHVGD